MELTGKLLAAMPGLGDPRFQRALILMCTHSDEGAMGIIVNHPLPDMPFAKLADQLGLQTRQGIEIKVHYGGPVEAGRGFILHLGSGAAASPSMKIAGGYQLSATLDVLEAMATGHGPSPALLALGYAGWSAGQLEAEIADNAWLTLDGLPEIVFAPNAQDKWANALRHSGVNPTALSGAAGHA